MAHKPKLENIYFPKWHFSFQKPQSINGLIMVTETSRANLIPSYKIGFEISTDSSNFVKHAKLFREDFLFSFLSYLPLFTSISFFFTNLHDSVNWFFGSFNFLCSGKSLKTINSFVIQIASWPAQAARSFQIVFAGLLRSEKDVIDVRNKNWPKSIFMFL